MSARPATRRRRAVALLLGGALLTSASVTAAIAASQASASSVGLAVTPGTLSLSAGDQGAYDVSLKRKSFPGEVTLSVSGLPAGASGAFAPAKTTGSASRLTVTTGPSTPTGSYTLTVGATSSLGFSSVNVKLTVGQSVTNPKAFTIAGTMSGLAPGAPVPLNLSVTNPNNQPISVTNLHVTIALSSAPNASAQRPCSAADFTVTQMAPSAYPIAVPANSTRQLGGALPSTAWPVARVVETGANQDGCKGAVLTLTYTGTAQGGNP
jgi:hypothetical protein